MKKILLLTVLTLCGAALLGQDRYIVRKVVLQPYAKPNPSSQLLYSRVFHYGDTITTVGEESGMAVIEAEKYQKGYFSKQDLIKVTRNFADIPVREKISMPIWQTDDYFRIYTEPNAPRDKSTQYYRSIRLYDVTEYNKRWISIPMAGGEKAYIKKGDVKQLTEREKYALFAPDQMPEELTKEPVVTEKKPINLQPGKKLFYAILGLGGVLLVLSIFRYKQGGFERAIQGVYCTTLFVMSLLEMWYISYMGLNNIYWFLSFDHILRTLLYAVCLLFFVWVQFTAFLNILDDMTREYRMSIGKKLWVLAGVGFGVVFLAIASAIFGQGDQMTVGFEGMAMLFLILGQIPVAFIYLKSSAVRFPLGKVLFLIYYPIMAAAIISLTLASIYIFIILFFIYAMIAAKGGRRETDGERQARRSGEEKAGIDLDNLRGNISDREAEGRKRNIDRTNY